MYIECVFSEIFQGDKEEQEKKKTRTRKKKRKKKKKKKKKKKRTGTGIDSTEEIKKTRRRNDDEIEGKDDEKR